MDLHYLPEELVEEIASYLTLEEIQACSRVNSSWEETFNIDRIWRRFCTFHPNYFDKQISKVGFSPNSEFFHICNTKELVLKEMFVKRNCIAGVFHIKEVKIDNFYCENVIDGVDGVGNHWMFISLMDGSSFEGVHKIQMWNMNSDPVLHTCVATPSGKTRRLLDSEMKMTKDKLFFIHETNVLVYEFIYPLYELVLLYQVNVSLSKFAGYLVKNTKVICIHDLILAFVYTTIHVCQNLPPSVEIWNHKGVFIRTDYDSIDFQNHRSVWPPVLEIKSNDSENIIVVFTYQEENNTGFRVKIFDSYKLKYTDFLVSKEGILCACHAWMNTLILFYRTVHRTNIYAEGYDIDNGNKLFHGDIFTKNYFCEFVVNISDCEFITHEKNSIYVYNFAATGLSQVSGFKVPAKIYRVTILEKSVLLLVQSFFGRRVVNEVWNYRSGERMYKLDFSSELGFNQGLHRFSNIRDNSFPPKLVAFKDPMETYPRSVKNNSLFVISFW